VYSSVHFEHLQGDAYDTKADDVSLEAYQPLNGRSYHTDIILTPTYFEDEFGLFEDAGGVKENKFLTPLEAKVG